MNSKKGNSPLNQRFSGNVGTRFTQPSQSYQTNFMPTAVSGLNTVSNGIQATSAMSNQMQQTPINPRGFSNMDTISNMYGQSNPGTFTRNVGSPLAQNVTEGRMTSQGYMPGIDPTDASLQPDIDAIQATTGMPIPPPIGVSQPIAPFYDLSTK